MAVPQHYMAVFFGTLAAVGAYRLALLVMHLTSRSLFFVFTKYIQYPLLIRRRYWGSVTRLQGLCISIYIGANALCMGLNVSGAQAFEQRAALMAIVNAVPLFLGGRTNPLTDLLGVSLPSYYLAHHWIGRVVIIEATIHSIGVLVLQPRPGFIVTSGWIVSRKSPSFLVAILSFI